MLANVCIKSLHNPTALIHQLNSH